MAEVVILNRSMSDDFGEYFSSYENKIAKHKHEKDLDAIKDRAVLIREEVSKPHKCIGQKCICNVIKINLDVLEAHIKNLEENLTNGEEKA